jgi:hypothetical protein
VPVAVAVEPPVLVAEQRDYEEVFLVVQVVAVVVTMCQVLPAAQVILHQHHQVKVIMVEVTVLLQVLILQPEVVALAQ